MDCGRPRQVSELWAALVRTTGLSNLPPWRACERTGQHLGRGEVKGGPEREFRRPLCPSWRAGFAPIPTKSGASKASGWILGSWERRRPGPASAASRSLQKIVGAIVGAASRAGREHLQGSSPPDFHHKPDSGRPRRPGPAPIRASEGLRAPVAMVVSPRPERAGQADQDGRPSGAALTAINLSVIRGVGSSKVVRGSVGSHRPVITGAKLRERRTTILPRGRVLQGVALSSDRLHPSIEDPVTTKTDNECGLRWQSYSLSARPSVDRLRRA